MQEHQFQIFSRTASDTVEAINICNIIQQHGGNVFSVVKNENKYVQYEIWGKYDSSEKLINIDLAIKAFRDAYWL